MRMTRRGDGGAVPVPWLVGLATLALVVWLLWDRRQAPPPPVPEAAGPAATPAEIDHTLRAADAVVLPPVPPATAPAVVPHGPAPEGSELLQRMRASPESFRAVVVAARTWFDLDEAVWQGRAALVAALEGHAGAGDRILATPDALRWLVAQGRSFLPPMSDRRWQRANGILDHQQHRGLHALASQDLAILWQEPEHLASRTARAWQRAYPRPEPAPLLIVMHDRTTPDGSADVRAAWLREHVLTPAMVPFSSQAYVLMPVAPEGTYLDAEGLPDAPVFQQALSRFWKHAHVDFDRFVLEGGQEAFVIGTSMPVFFAGIVLRGGWSLTSKQAAEVRNLAHVPVYVIDDPELGAALGAAGHPDVTVGSRDARAAWMLAQRRAWPREFSWTAARTDQSLAWWINLDACDWRAPSRCLEVSIGGLVPDRNVIDVRTTGIRGLSLFLDDRTVDLDRPVRLRVNGRVAFDRLLTPADTRLAPIARDLDFLFDREPLRIRQSMYFGWLTPARITGIPVRIDVPGTCGPPMTTPVAEPTQPVVRGTAERLDHPTVPPPVDPGEPGIETPTEPPGWLDGWWVLALLGACLAFVLLRRRR